MYHDYDEPSDHDRDGDRPEAELIVCEECGAEYHDDEAACPECAADRPEARPHRVRHWDDDDRDDDDRDDFADPGGTSALRASSRTNPRNLPCPTCHEPNRLTPADRARGYQCDGCADQAERGGY